MRNLKSAGWGHPAHKIHQLGLVRMPRSLLRGSLLLGESSGFGTSIQTNGRRLCVLCGSSSVFSVNQNHHLSTENNEEPLLFWFRGGAVNCAENGVRFLELSAVVGDRSGGRHGELDFGWRGDVVVAGVVESWAAGAVGVGDE